MTWTTDLASCGIIDKQTKQMLQVLQREGGWEGRKARHGVVVRRVDDHAVMANVTGTPSDRRAYRNAVASLRRCGAKLDGV